MLPRHFGIASDLSAMVDRVTREASATDGDVTLSPTPPDRTPVERRAPGRSSRTGNQVVVIALAANLAVSRLTSHVSYLTSHAAIAMTTRNFRNLPRQCRRFRTRSLDIQYAGTSSSGRQAGVP